MYFRFLLVTWVAIVLVLSEGQEVSECKDLFRSCHVYPKRVYCLNENYRPFMEKYCAKYCGFCDCHQWIYGCCRDGKTNADGPREQGCAVKLCYDVFVDGCPESKKNGTCSSPETLALMKERCPYSCGFCKHFAPSKSECLNSRYGCCWDGDFAVGPDQKGCRPCVDTYPHACKEFAVPGSCSNSGAYYTRTFLEKNCPKSCGVCPVSGCYDRAGEAKCVQWLIKGYCKNSIWKPYMMDSCAKTCDLCEEEGMIA
ncbi:papilin-like [Actinia tenebrosa]|uniref:Papilin-like n=1 Tax=Actinia tenebrosa TaxID=6105 RepID=A0A6P8HRX5_ACTTE|nr:papilin-like [Actinia tenebrosa]